MNTNVINNGIGAANAGAATNAAGKNASPAAAQVWFRANKRHPTYIAPGISHEQKDTIPWVQGFSIYAQHLLALGIADARMILHGASCRLTPFTCARRFSLCCCYCVRLSCNVHEQANGVMHRQSLQKLLQEVDPQATEKLNPDVEDVLLDIVDEFVETATRFSCDLAQHRGGSSLEAKDLKLHLGTWTRQIPTVSCTAHARPQNETHGRFLFLSPFPAVVGASNHQYFGRFQCTPPFPVAFPRRSP